MKENAFKIKLKNALFLALGALPPNLVKIESEAFTTIIQPTSNLNTY